MSKEELERRLAFHEKQLQKRKPGSFWYVHSEVYYWAYLELLTAPTQSN